MTETKKVEEKKPVASVGAAVGTDEFFAELDKALHSGSIKVAPAAGWWMRTYMVLPSEVKATGPKGYILKGDVLAHIEKNKLQKGVRVGGTKSAAGKGDAPKKPSGPKAAPQSQAADPNDPFRQSWTDAVVAGDYSEVAEAIFTQKRYAAHTYMSSMCDVSIIEAQVKELGGDAVAYDNYVLKAASKAFSKCFPEEPQVNLQQVISSHEDKGMKFIQAANEQPIGALGGGETFADLYAYSTDSPACTLTVSKVANTFESLPIVSNRSLISLHFTQP